NFPEYQSTCMGYSSGNIEGRGSGIEFNDKIFQSAIKLPADGRFMNSNFICYFLLRIACMKKSLYLTTLKIIQTLVTHQSTPVLKQREV
ncbi:hypothetical protein LOX96_09480, partial [Legionella sp. HCPI-6]